MQKMPNFGGLKFDVTTPIKHFYGRIINFNCYNYFKILNTFYIFDNSCSLISRLLSACIFVPHNFINMSLSSFKRKYYAAVLRICFIETMTAKLLQF